VVPAILARQKGRSALGWFVLALVISHPTQVARPFHTKGWVYEEKIDGWRMLALKDAGRVRLVSCGVGSSRGSRGGSVRVWPVMSRGRGFADGATVVEGRKVGFALEEAKARVEDWRRDSNGTRPHQALG
jgi:hypothetical protein